MLGELVDIICILSYDKNKTYNKYATEEVKKEKRC